MSSTRLKEQDELIQLIRKFICEHQEVPFTIQEAFEAVQDLLNQHYDAYHNNTIIPGKKTKLQKFCPNIKKTFTRYDLVNALHEYDSMTTITKRQFVPPSFFEVRQVINLAVAHAVAPNLKLLTLDADDTI